MSNLLEVSGLTVTFGGVQANCGIDLNVPTGAFVGLIGPNGAGKTTFIDAITGYVRPSTGQVRFRGEPITHRKPYELARLGLVRTFQSLELFEDLSVRDNLRVARQRRRWYTFMTDLIGRSRSTEEIDADIDWVLSLLGLEDVAQARPTELSHGRRKLVAVARALASRPDLVMLDEPAAGLDSTESQEVGRRLRTLTDHGISVFVIDHDMGLIMGTCDLIYVLEFGELIGRGTPDEIRGNERVVEAYLGARRAQTGADESLPPAETLL